MLCYVRISNNKNHMKTKKSLHHMFFSSDFLSLLLPSPYQ